MAKGIIPKIWNVITGNKYLLTIFLFLLWLVFFDQDNLIERAGNQRELETLRKEIDTYQHQIEEDKHLLRQMNEPEFLEKFAREEYFMKRENEDIFIVVEE